VASSPRVPGVLWTLLGAVLLVALVHVPTALRAQFLNFDDNLFFGPDQPLLQAGPWTVLTQPIANAYLPVAHVSLWLDAWLGGGGPLWPHLAALLWHAAVAAALVRLLLRLGLGVAASHLAGALFAVHPALAESAVWVAGRKDLLSGLWVLLLLQIQVRARSGANGRLLLGAALCAALAMYSKPTAVVQPLLAALVAAATGPARSRWWVVVVALGVTAPIAWHHQTIAAAEGTLAAGSVAARLSQVAGAFWHYLGTAFWPRHLNVLYPEVQTLERFAAAGWPAYAAGTGLLAVLGLLWWRPRWRWVALGGTGFTVALLPFNTAFPASSIAAADRYLYLALPFAALAVVAAATAAAGRAGLVAAGLLLVPLGGAAMQRSAVFASSEELWTASLAAEADNAVAHLNLVDAQLARGVPIDQARQQLEAAARSARYPIHEFHARRRLAALALRVADWPAAAAEARAAIAAATAQLARETAPQRVAAAQLLLLQARLAAFEPLRRAGEREAAEALYQRLVAECPEQPEVVAFAALRDLEAATAGRDGPLAAADPRAVAADAALAAALAQHPQHPLLHVAQAGWDQVRGRVLAAVRHYQLAQTADPGNLDAWLGVARLLRERECWEDAARYASEGFRHVPDPALLQEQALALVGMGRLDDAIHNLQAYRRVRPNDADVAKVLSNLLVGRAYTRLNDPRTPPAEVQRMVEEALAYNPNEPRAHVVLGRLCRDRRQFAAAVEHLEAAHRSMPDYLEAQQQLADCLFQLGMQQVLAKDDAAAAVAFLRCRAVAPPDFDRAGLRLQLQRLWRVHEQLGLRRRQDGDAAGAAAAFRRCLELDPEQHWAAWLLATTLHGMADADLQELERLARLALAWQEQHGLDRSQQVWLLADVLRRRGESAAAAALATDYLARPDSDAKANTLRALQGFAGR
jgi:tetratricopeptide (TPR) repeat protein